MSIDAGHRTSLWQGLRRFGNRAALPLYLPPGAAPLGSWSSKLKMPAFANPLPALTRGPWKLGRLCAILLFCLCGISRAHAGATLFLEEPYSYDGTFAGTGHVAVYLSNVCAESPVVLRRCAEGEYGGVLGRYDRLGGNAWIAVPLIPYLYHVDL